MYMQKFNDLRNASLTEETRLTVIIPARSGSVVLAFNEVDDAEVINYYKEHLNDRNHMFTLGCNFEK